MAPGKIDFAGIRAGVSIKPVIERAGVKLTLRSGKLWGLCPFHGEKTPSFNVRTDQGTYHCFGCGAHGDVIDFVAAVENITLVEAAKRLLENVAPVTARVRLNPVTRQKSDFSIRTARDLLAIAGPAKGTIVEAWFAGRGLDPARDVPWGGIRFHASAPFYRVGTRMVTAPAMVVPMLKVAAGGGFDEVGAHVTYLSPDGRNKAIGFDPDGGGAIPARKMWGEAGFAALTPLVPGPGSGPLIVGEGIETVLSAAVLIKSGAPASRVGPAADGRGTRLMAVLTLNNLQGFPLAGKDGEIDPDAPLLNPARAPITIPDAGDVIICVDADMGPVKVKVRERRRLVTREISGLARARLCGALAAQGWRRAGAATVSVMRPDAGADFNDQLMEMRSWA